MNKFQILHILMDQIEKAFRNIQWIIHIRVNYNSNLLIDFEYKYYFGINFEIYLIFVLLQFHNFFDEIIF